MSVRTRRAEGGFTLVEVMVATTLMIVVLGVVFSVYIGQQRNFIIGNSYLDIHQSARIAMDSMAKDLRWTKELVSSKGGYTTATSSPRNCIVLKVPSIDSSHNVIDGKFDYFVYRLNEGALERIVTDCDASSHRSYGIRTIAKNVDSIAFTWRDKNDLTPPPPIPLDKVTAIDIALTLKKSVAAIASMDVSERLVTTVALRNTSKKYGDAP